MMMYFSSRPPQTILLGRANYLRQLANESVFLFTKIASSANTDAGVLSVLEYTRRLTRNLVWDWTLPPNIANSGRVMVTMASDGDVQISWKNKLGNLQGLDEDKKHLESHDWMEAAGLEIWCRVQDFIWHPSRL